MSAVRCPLTVAADYVNLSDHYFQSPFLAVREILDNMLAPSRSRNIALFNGRPLTITVDVTVLGSVVDPQTGHEKLKKKLCITCNGSAPSFGVVQSIVSLGHSERVFRPFGVKAPEDGQLNSHPNGPAEAGEPVYGFYGHGHMMAVNSLGYCVWLANYIDPDSGKQERWVALHGDVCQARSETGGNVLQSIFLHVPEGVETAEDLMRTCTDQPSRERLRQSLALLTKEWKDRVGSTEANLWDFTRPFKTFSELMQALAHMKDNEQTQRLDIYTFKDIKALSQRGAGGHADNNDIKDMKAPLGQDLLSQAILTWYMPYSSTFPLRQHLTVPPTEFPPRFVVQGRTVDICGGPWQQLLSAAVAVKAPGHNLSGQELLDKARDAGLNMSEVLNVEAGGHICKMVVLFAEKRLWTQMHQHRMEGVLLYTDSDRAIWSTARLPAQFEQELRCYYRELESTGFGTKAYTLLMNAYKLFEDAAKHNLPTSTRMIARAKQCKDVARWMGLMQMTAFVMLPRGMLKQQKLLTDQKDDLASNTVTTQLLRSIILRIAQFIWQHAETTLGPVPANNNRRRKRNEAATQGGARSASPPPDGQDRAEPGAGAGPSNVGPSNAPDRRYPERRRTQVQADDDEEDEEDSMPLSRRRKQLHPQHLPAPGGPALTAAPSRPDPPRQAGRPATQRAAAAATHGFANPRHNLVARAKEVVAAANNIIKLAGDEDGMEVEGDAPMAELEAAVAFVEQATQALVEAASNLS